MNSKVRENARNACNLQQLIEHAHQIERRWERRWSPIPMRSWFRGADNHSYSLDPGLLRSPYLRDDPDNFEYSISNDFRIRGRPYFKTYPLNPWDQIFLMQHYGFPTRLLDWAESLVVATYFAVRDIDSTDAGSVWLLSTQWLVNRAVGQYATHYFAGHEDLEKYKLVDSKVDLDEFNKLVPLPIIPDQFDSRMINQHGRFTIHSFKPGALEELANEDYEEFGDACFLQQIIIPPCAKPLLRQQVRVYGGACEDTLFPDLDGMARSFRWEILENAKKA